MLCKLQGLGIAVYQTLSVYVCVLFMFSVSFF